MKPRPISRPELRDHLRYPDDLFRCSATCSTATTVTDPGQFFNSQNFSAVHGRTRRRATRVASAAYYIVAQRRVRSSRSSSDQRAERAVPGRTSPPTSRSPVIRRTTAPGRCRVTPQPGGARPGQYRDCFGSTPTSPRVAPAQPAGFPGGVRQPADPAGAAVACSTSSRLYVPAQGVQFPRLQFLVAFGNRSRSRRTFRCARFRSSVGRRLPAPGLAGRRPPDPDALGHREAQRRTDVTTGAGPTGGTPSRAAERRAHPAVRGVRPPEGGVPQRRREPGSARRQTESTGRGGGRGRPVSGRADSTRPRARICPCPPALA